jgi:hypothetical protein
MDRFDIAIPAVIRWSIQANDEEEAEEIVERLVDSLGASFPAPGDPSGRVFPNEVIEGEIDMAIRHQIRLAT